MNVDGTTQKLSILVISIVSTFLFKGGAGFYDTALAKEKEGRLNDAEMARRRMVLVS